MSVSSTFLLLFLITVAGLLFYIMIEESAEVPKPAQNVPLAHLKYILDWKLSTAYHYSRFGEGSSAFEQNLCRYSNCYVTNDLNHLADIRDFAALLFQGKEIFLHRDVLPPARSQKQKYVFASRESAHNYPLCDPIYNGYFNWTWTYRLDSDFLWAYILVYDLEGNLVAPKINTNWLTTYRPINDELKMKLRMKRKTAAWFVSHCKTSGKREKFVEAVTLELKQYRMNIDIYGTCFTKLRCPANLWYCNNIIEKDYYYYFAFENSLDEDYVTEKLMIAFNNFAVPVVYGGANYSRFLPPGSYLDGRKLGAKLLARTMRDIIKDRSRYEDMFRWRNHYKIKEPHYVTDVCQLCAKLNNATEMARETTWGNFRAWWNSDPSWCSKWKKKRQLQEPPGIGPFSG